MNPPRIALLGMALESNAFAPVSTEEDFRSLCYLEGMDMLTEAAKPHPAMPFEMVSFIREWSRRGAWMPVPILLTAAEPGGPVEQAFLDKVLAEIARRLKAELPVDAVYIASHGAMTATAELDADGLFCRTVRDIVGPGVPIVVTFDLHANISTATLDSVDLMIGYRTNPHVDQVERGAEAAQAIVDLLAKKPLHTASVRLPLVAPTVTLLTADGPFADLMRAGEGVIGGDVVNVSIAGGFVFSDTPKNGMTFLAAARRPGLADRIVRELAAKAWADRRRFNPSLTSVEDAVAMVKQRSDDPSLPSLILADVADNPGGGGRGNTTFLMEALLMGGAQKVLMGLFFDPRLAEEAHHRGIGKRWDATFNRGGHIGFTRRFSWEARVEALSDGRCIGSPKGIWAGKGLDLGPSAVLDLGGVKVVVVSKRKQCADPVFFTMHGLDPAAARAVVVKSRGHFRAAFASLFTPDRVIEVDAPGLTSPVLSNFKFQHLPRPVYPLDQGASWQG